MSEPSEEFEYVWNAMRADDLAELEMIRQIVDGFPQSVDHWIGRRWIINAIDSGSLVTMTWMIEKRVPLVFRDDEGYTVLHRCIEQFSEHKDPVMHRAMRALIAAGADFNLKGINDWTPLHAAVAWGDLEAIQILLETGADRTIKTTIDNYESAEEHAIRIGYKGAIRLFSEIARQKI